MISSRGGFDFRSIRLEITRIAPEFEQEPIAWLGQGMDRFVVSVGASFAFRFTKHADGAAGLKREIALLPRLAPFPERRPRIPGSRGCSFRRHTSRRQS
jgi:hypothetical protein